MYNLSIFFGPSPVPAQFLFKDAAKAEEARRHAVEYSINDREDFFIEDEFGQKASFMKATVHAVILENMDLGEESRIQRGLSQARGQANANKRAQSDPVIMAAQRGAGPSVLTPFGNGRFNG